MKNEKAGKNLQVGLFSRVAPDVKGMFEDIVYALDQKNNAAMETVIRYSGQGHRRDGYPSPQGYELGSSPADNRVPL